MHDTKKAPFLGFFLAAELGLEPRQYESESYNVYPRIKLYIAKNALN